MKKNIIKLLLSAYMCAMILVGCSTEQEVKIKSNSSEKGKTKIEKQDIEEKEEAEEKEDMAYTNFSKATKLLDEAYKNKKENTMISPVSLDFALGMVLEGSSGQTREELAEFLGTDDYASKARELMRIADERTGTEETFIGESYNTAIEFANSIWLNDKYTLQKDYEELVEEAYKAEVDTVSFREADKVETADRINNWCNEKTHEMIPEIVAPENFNETTNSVLVNSVYFESPWITEWDNILEHTEFRNSDETKVETEFIKTYEAYSCYETDQAEAFTARYNNGYTFVGILPKSEGDFEASDIDLEALLSNEVTKYDEIHAVMPKLNFDTSVDSLADIIKESFGVREAFSSNSAQIDKMVITPDDKIIYISDIIQKTKIELDENGTKAAAVTAVIMFENCAVIEEKEPKVKEIILDRPFMFMIYDEDTQDILFIGKVVNL